MSQDAIIFTGSSLSSIECNPSDDILFLPPAKQGDIYRSWLQYKPKVIGLIDGNFENVPSPWHKEILFVMSEGVNVLGSSSMGALRAAELQTFGMIGVGEIFEAFSAGDLEDDDEVAIVHGPPPYYYNLSVPMVNIRKTFEKAYDNKIIERYFYDLLCERAKTTFYKKRNYDVIIDSFNSDDRYSKEAQNLRLWIVKNKIDQKKEDAKKLLLKVREILDRKVYQEKSNYFFENTNVFKKMREIINGEFN